MDYTVRWVIKPIFDNNAQVFEKNVSATTVKMLVNNTDSIRKKAIKYIYKVLELPIYMTKEISPYLDIHITEKGYINRLDNLEDQYKHYLLTQRLKTVNETIK